MAATKVPAARFKEKCMAMLEEVNEGKEYVITKRGTPVAKLVTSG